MARAFDDDLRRKFLAAYDRGTDGLKTVALYFGVSHGWARKVVGQRRRTGQAERVRHRPGPTSRITPEVKAYIEAQVARQADLTLAELQHLLLSERQVKVSIGRLWAVLRGMDLRLKKSRSTPPSATRKPTGNVAPSTLNASPRSTRRG
jgi:transposase